MNTETLHQQLDAWEEGQLSPTEIQALQQWIQDHPDAMQTLADRKLVAELMEFAIAQDLRQQFSNTPVRNSSPVFSLKRIASIAAVGLTLLAAGAILYATLGRFDHAEIVADLTGAAAIPYTGAIRGEGPEQTGSFHTLVLLIEDGQIVEAITRIEDSLEVYPQHTDLQYLLGYAALKKGDHQRSLELFEGITVDPAFPYADDLRWNSVLCKVYLAYPTDDIRHDLNAILEDAGSEHREDARLLSDRFNSFGYWLANLL